jgi:hypothetical protein
MVKKLSINVKKFVTNLSKICQNFNLKFKTYGEDDDDEEEEEEEEGDWWLLDQARLRRTW